MTLIDRTLDRWGRTGNFLTTILVAIAKQLRRKHVDPAIAAAVEQGRADALADKKAGVAGASHDSTDDGMTPDEAEAYIAAAPKTWFPGRIRRISRRRR